MPDSDNPDLEPRIQFPDSGRDETNHVLDSEDLAPTPLNVICFHYRPDGIESLDKINRINEQLLARINATGKVFLTHANLDGVYTIRLVIGQTNVTDRDVKLVWELIQNTAAELEA